jgi:two-component system cell cycle sensor histidine kinase/response regulator CckA
MPPAPCVLVVDDEEAVRRFAVAALKEFGYRTLEAGDAAAALALAEKNETFELLLTDLLMPQMRGDELARLLRHKNSYLKVVYLTGYADKLFEFRPTLWKHESVIEKPVTLAQLHDAVSVALFGHRGGIME